MRYYNPTILRKLQHGGEDKGKQESKTRGKSKTWGTAAQAEKHDKGKSKERGRGSLLRDAEDEDFVVDVIKLDEAQPLESLPVGDQLQALLQPLLLDGPAHP